MVNDLYLRKLIQNYVRFGLPCRAILLLQHRYTSPRTLASLRIWFETQILLLEPRAALAALLTGDLDFYTAAGTTGRAALRGVPVRNVMVALNRAEQCIVAAKEITSVEQLRGKTVGGYTAQASANIQLIEMLRRKGLKPEEYKILNMGAIAPQRS